MSICGRGTRSSMTSSMSASSDDYTANYGSEAQPMQGSGAFTEVVATAAHILDAVQVFDFTERSVVYYVVRVQTEHGKLWCVRRRFREFVRLQRMLVVQHPEIAIPELPPRTIFQASQQQIHSRIAALDSFLAELLQCTQLSGSLVLSRFLQAPVECCLGASSGTPTGHLLEAGSAFKRPQSDTSPASSLAHSPHISSGMLPTPSHTPDSEAHPLLKLLLRERSRNLALRRELAVRDSVNSTRSTLPMSSKSYKDNFSPPSRIDSEDAATANATMRIVKRQLAEELGKERSRAQAASDACFELLHSMNCLLDTQSTVIQLISQEGKSDVRKQWKSSPKNSEEDRFTNRIMDSDWVEWLEQSAYAVLKTVQTLAGIGATPLEGSVADLLKEAVVALGNVKKQAHYAGLFEVEGRMSKLIAGSADILPPSPQLAVAGSDSSSVSTLAHASGSQLLDSSGNQVAANGVRGAARSLGNDMLTVLSHQVFGAQKNSLDAADVQRAQAHARAFAAAGRAPENCSWTSTPPDNVLTVPAKLSMGSPSSVRSLSRRISNADSSIDCADDGRSASSYEGYKSAQGDDELSAPWATPPEHR